MATAQTVIAQPKDLQPFDTKRPSISVLGHDILRLILEALRSSHILSLRNVRLVSSMLRYLSDYVSVRTFRFDLKSTQSERVAAHLDSVEQKGLLPAIREIEVSKTHTYESNLDPGMQLQYQRVQQQFHLMTGLRNVRLVNGGLSDGLVTVLAGLSQVRLHIRLSPTDHIGLLMNNHNLVSLDITYAYRSAKECLALTRPLKNVLLTSPNLRELSLDIHMPRSGCVSYGVPWEACGMGFVDGERPPALEKLQVKDYPFGSARTHHTFDGNIYPAPFSEGYVGEINEIDYWASVFDWSKTKFLAIRSASDALQFMPRLTALEEVSIDHSVAESETCFYLNVPTILKTIRVKLLDRITLAGILRHGPNLRELELHRCESFRTEWAAECIDGLALRSIRDECRYIEDLRVDLARSVSWPYEVLDIIASFPRLRRLTIWFALGTGGDVVEPKVTFAVAQMLWQYLWQRAPRLQQLDLHSGAPAPMGIGYPSPLAYWPYENSMHFRCTPAVRDDEAARGMFVCECPTLDVMANEYLRGERDTLEDIQTRHRGRNRVMVAKTGPVPCHGW